MDIVDQIRQGLRKPGKKKSELARVIGKHANVVTNILKGERQVKAHEVEPIQKYLELEAAPRIVGLAGASSSEEVYFAHADDPQEFAPPIEGGSPDTVAVEIRGTSLGAGFNGWLAYYDDRREPVTPDLIGRLCVVGLDGGKVLIKVLRSAPGGRYHLFPNAGGEVIPDADVRWAARVIDLKPKS